MELKLYNIGVVTKSNARHVSHPIGFHVKAATADAAYERVVEYCTKEGIELQSGWAAQRRSEVKGENQWFDMAYDFFQTIEG